MSSYKLRGYWKRKHEESLGKPFRGNVHRDSAQLRDIIDDIGYEETEKLVDFYFEVHPEPDFFWFIYNYDKLQKEESRRAEDRRHRQSLREATRKRMEELRFEG